MSTVRPRLAWGIPALRSFHRRVGTSTHRGAVACAAAPFSFSGEVLPGGGARPMKWGKPPVPHGTGL